QDAPYYLVRGAQSVSFWVPLDPVPRDRTIEFVAGSHLAGKEYRPDRFDGTRLYEGDMSEPVP
ncbi:MAG: phytanoyl-CoA dioxygenase, partial [Xanthomonadales bacterium]|nr:phytanoyl-CoA dioxygenase [Xanthomonadales bacterium]